MQAVGKTVLVLAMLMRMAKKQHPVGLDWQNNNFARASRYSSFSLPSLLDYDMEIPIFMFCGRRNKRQ